jgi:ketosteroid isomerase-like protein
VKCVPLVLLTIAPVLAQSPKKAFQDEIVAQERAELDSLKTGDMAAFTNFLADDAVFVDSRGSAGKAEVVEHSANVRLHDYSITDVRFVRLSSESGLIVYHLDESGTSHGKEFSAKVLVSALWAKRGGKWVCVFSQETAAK